MFSNSIKFNHPKEGVAFESLIANVVYYTEFTENPKGNCDLKNPTVALIIQISRVRD